MAAKIFEVGDVLPATTQLRIYFDGSSNFNKPIIQTDYEDNGIEFQLFYSDGIFYRFKETIYVLSYYSVIGNDVDVLLDRIYNYDGPYEWESPYNSTTHNYIDINTNLWPLSMRTITYVDSIGTGFAWQDLAPTPSGYTITFNSNGGTTISDIEEATELPTPLPTPTKSGYTFVNWYYDSAFTQIANAGDTIESNVTLYAKWQLITYTITYNSNGGSSVSQTTGVTTLPSTLPTTTRVGYTFVAWYIDSALTTRAVADATIEEDTTLYAKWHNLGSLFTEIADAIRSKDGTSENIRDVDFPDRIRALIVEPPTPSGYTVTIIKDDFYNTSVGYLSYSFDNGTIWVDIMSDIFPITLNGVAQIKLKMTKTGSYLCSLYDVTNDVPLINGINSGETSNFVLDKNTTYQVHIMVD